jgi:hypothetical protein
VVAFLGAIHDTLLGITVGPLVGNGVAVMADQAVDVEALELIRLGISLCIVFFLEGILPVIDSGDNFLGHRVFGIGQLGQVALGTPHQVFDFHVFRLLDPRIGPLHKAVYHRGLEGGSSPAGTEDGAGVDRFVPIVVGILVTVDAGTGVVHLSQLGHGLGLTRLGGNAFLPPDAGLFGKDR